MRVIWPEAREDVYTSNVYLVLGSWSRLEDVNTLVDVGRDPALLEWVRQAPTGVGKRPVEQVILTHSHYDHTSLLPAIRQAFHPKVFAFSPGIDGVDGLLSDGDEIKMGDAIFEVIHTPGHSSDSICLYNQTEGVLFAGDSPLLIASPTGTYEAGFVAALEKLCARDVQRIYFGHGAPLIERCNQRLRESRRVASGGPTASGRRERIKDLPPVTA